MARVRVRSWTGRETCATLSGLYPRSPSSATGEGSSLCGLCSAPRDPAIRETQKASPGEQWQVQRLSMCPWSCALPTGSGLQTKSRLIPNKDKPGHAHAMHEHPRTYRLHTGISCLDTHIVLLGMNMDTLTCGPPTPLGHGGHRAIQCWWTVHQRPTLIV